MPAIQGSPDIPHLLRKRQNITARSAPRGAPLAKQTVKKQIRTNFDLRNSSDLFRLVNRIFKFTSRITMRKAKVLRILLLGLEI